MQKLVIVAVTLFLVACAGPGARPATGPIARAVQAAPGPFTPNGEASASAGKVTTQMQDSMKFAPNTIKAKAGQTVTVELKNGGTTIHNFVAPGLGVATAARATAGQTVTASFTAPAAGTYEFWCNEPGHAEAGMIGQVVVE
jgi:uncharacterized cupredoxin-like copper-binding protein